jgi:hypothetical protein
MSYHLKGKQANGWKAFIVNYLGMLDFHGRAALGGGDLGSSSNIALWLYNQVDSYWKTTMIVVYSFRLILAGNKFPLSWRRS